MPLTNIFGLQSLTDEAWDNIIESSWNLSVRDNSILFVSTSGVPQGSNFEPLLFFFPFFSNDIVDFISMMVLFLKYSTQEPVFHRIRTLDLCYFLTYLLMILLALSVRWFWLLKISIDNRRSTRFEPWTSAVFFFVFTNDIFNVIRMVVLFLKYSSQQPTSHRVRNLKRCCFLIFY